jgi:hypothetical protein
MRMLRSGGRAVSMPLPVTEGEQARKREGAGKVASLIRMYEHLNVS